MSGADETSAFYSAPPRPKSRIQPVYAGCKDVDLSSLTEQENTVSKTKTEGKFCFSCSAKSFFGFETINETSSAVQSKAFKKKLQKRVIGQMESKIFQTKMLKACITGDRNWFSAKKVDESLMKEVCKKEEQNIKSAVNKNWSKMRINLALSSPTLREDRILPDRATWFDSSPSHTVSEFNKMSPLNEKEKKQAERIYINTLSKTPLEKFSPSEFRKRLKEGSALYAHLSPEKFLTSRDKQSLRMSERKLRKKAKESYLETMSRLPILGYLKSRSPDNQELGAGFVKMGEELGELLEKVKDSEVDMGLLLSFKPLVEELVKEDKSYCLAAESARVKAEEDESLKNFALLGVGILAGIPCFITGPAGATACLAGGMALGVVGYKEAELAKRESLGRVLTGAQFETMAGLEARAREEFLTKLFLPLGAWGTTAIPARAASATVTQAVKRLKDKTKPLASSSSLIAKNPSGKFSQVLKKQRGRLLSAYDKILKSKSTEEQDIIMSAIIGMELKGINKSSINQKVQAAIGRCKIK